MNYALQQLSSPQNENVEPSCEINTYFDRMLSQFLACLLPVT